MSLSNQVRSTLKQRFPGLSSIVQSYFYMLLLCGCLVLLPLPPTAFGGDNLTDPDLVRLSTQLTQRVKLSITEESWLAAGHRVRIRASEIPPYMFAIDKPKGLIVDYLSVICQAHRIHCEFVPLLGGDFKYSLSHLGLADMPDIIPSVRRTPERDGMGVFTSEYLFSPWVILTRTGGTEYLGGIHDLKDKNVLVEKGYLIGEKLRNDVPGIRFTEVSSTRKALETLATGEGDAYVGSLTQATYLIAELGLSNIKIAAPTSYQTQGEGMIVRKDWQELASIINKSLAAMTLEDKQVLRNRWVGIDYDAGISRSFAIGISLLALILVTFLALSWRWNRYLTAEIAARKQAEESRRESDEKFRSLYTSMTEGVALHEVIFDDNDKVVDYRLIEANPSFESITGLNRASAIGRKASELYGCNPPPYLDIYSAVASTRIPNHFETHYEPMGKTLSISVFSPKENQFATVFEDISERKNRERDAAEMRDQLAQASKMESIGHLTAGIAHDFNNMLGAMMGYSELTQNMLAAGKPESVMLYQKEILKAGTRAKELIAQMLAFGRLSPEVEGEAAPVTLLMPIVKEVVSLLRSSIPSTVDLNYRIEDDEIKARIQPVHLHQILLNLGVNARDSMGEYGRIDVTLSHYHAENLLCIACSQLFFGDYAQITVKDSGSGIPEQVLNKMFDPFFTTKDVGKGTGMGLSVVHGLVHTLGGHVLVETNPANGTSFNILLPIELNQVPVTINAEIEAVTDIKGVRIMVVDDEQPLATMMQEYLFSYGARVVSFTNPVKALDAFFLNADDFDLVITDETMPGISGMLLAEKMLKVKPGLPIILCTGFSDHANSDTVSNIGIKGFFSKPLNMQALLQKIHALRT